MPALALKAETDDRALDVDRSALAFLRIAAARSRCHAKADLFEACAALSVNPAREAEALAATLFQGVSGQGGVPRLRLYQPAAPEVSFDERWLLSALAAAGRGDADSLTFLIARRIPFHARRNIGFLIRALARALSEQGNPLAA